MARGRQVPYISSMAGAATSRRKTTTTGVLRRARRGDVDGILALIGDHPDQLLPRRRAEVERLLPTFWVVVERRTVVGCCCLEVYSRKIAEVRSLAVRETARGKRYGARLVRAAVNEARRLGIPQILVVTSNVKFFERLSFRPCLRERYALFWEAPPRARA